LLKLNYTQKSLTSFLSTPKRSSQRSGKLIKPTYMYKIRSNLETAVVRIGKKGDARPTINVQR